MKLTVYFFCNKSKWWSMYFRNTCKSFELIIKLSVGFGLFLLNFNGKHVFMYCTDLIHTSGSALPVIWLLLSSQIDFLNLIIQFCERCLFSFQLSFCITHQLCPLYFFFCFVLTYDPNIKSISRMTAFHILWLREYHLKCFNVK